MHRGYSAVQSQERISIIDFIEEKATTRKWRSAVGGYCRKAYILSRLDSAHCNAKPRAAKLQRSPQLLLFTFGTSSQSGPDIVKRVRSCGSCVRPPYLYSFCVTVAEQFHKQG
jgi:hypothetical protein